MTPDLLSLPVGALALRCDSLSAENSVRAAAERLRTSGLPAIPVVRDGTYIGVVTEETIYRAIAEGVDPNNPVLDFVDARDLGMGPDESGSAALRRFEQTASRYLIIVDGNGSPVGILSPSRLFDPVPFENRPTMMGGMATPFGVYLTNGSVRGGVSPWALVATGALMFVLLTLGSILADSAALLLPLAWQKMAVVPWVLRIGALLLFRSGLWVVGLSGLHASEHQVVNAVEQGEPIEYDVVRRMSRIHPRCGTNIAVAMTLFLAISSWTLIADQELRTLAAVLITFIFWRPLGTLAQKYLTTSPPTPKQTMKGIEAAKDFLRKYERHPETETNPLIRLYNSGLFHVIFGATLVSGLLVLAGSVLHLPPSWRAIIGI